MGERVTRICPVMSRAVLDRDQVVGLIPCQIGNCMVWDRHNNRCGLITTQIQNISVFEPKKTVQRQRIGPDYNPDDLIKSPNPFCINKAEFSVGSIDPQR